MKTTTKRQQNRKRNVGNLVTGILYTFGANSIESLASHVQQCANQPLEYVCSAVQRTLRNGVRYGFLVKQNNKYSLSGRTNRTDYDDAYLACKDGIEDVCVTAKRKKEACCGLNLMLFKRCSRRSLKYRYGDSHETYTNIYCMFHSKLHYYLIYRELFIGYFTEIESVLEKSGRLTDVVEKSHKTKKDKDIIKNASAYISNFLDKYTKIILDIETSFEDESILDILRNPDERP